MMKKEWEKTPKRKVRKIEAKKEEGERNRYGAAELLSRELL
jgi:hypothetical protein